MKTEKQYAITLACLIGLNPTLWASDNSPEIGNTTVQNTAANQQPIDDSVGKVSATNQNTGTADSNNNLPEVDKAVYGCQGGVPWCKTFYFGVQFLPEYDASNDGNFKGLSEQVSFSPSLPANGFGGRRNSFSPSR